MRITAAIGLTLFSSLASAGVVNDSFSAALGSAKAAANQGALCMETLKQGQDSEQCKTFAKAHDVYTEKLKGLRISLESSKDGPEAAAGSIPPKDWDALKLEGRKIQLVIDYVESFAQSHK